MGWTKTCLWGVHPIDSLKIFLDSAASSALKTGNFQRLRIHNAEMKKTLIALQQRYVSALREHLRLGSSAYLHCIAI
jgi:hypothetical protein